MAIPKSEQRARNLEAQKRCRARKLEKKLKKRAAARAHSDARVMTKISKRPLEGPCGTRALHMARCRIFTR